MSAAADDVRVQEARRWLASFPADAELARMTAVEQSIWVVRMHGAAQLLDAYVRGEEDQVTGDTQRLDRIRVVLAKFDWEHDDRQYALEAIERIVEGGQS